MEPKNALEKFGMFLVENLRDKAIIYSRGLLDNHWKSPGTKQIQEIFGTLSEEQKKALEIAFVKTIDTAIHDFLFALQEQAESGNDIQITVDGKNLVELSDGIHGEAYTDEGWYAKFSRYKNTEF